MGNIMKRSIILLTIIPIIICGCAKQQPAVVAPVPRAVTVPNFALKPVDAVGGERAWADTQVILGECTAKFYRPDGTFYLTRQRYAVYPWADSIRISANEPQGIFTWQLTGSSFVLLEGAPSRAAALPITLCDPYIARAVWSIMAAPASIAAKADPNITGLGEPISVYGLWHYPLRLTDGPMWYLNRDSGIFDIYQVEGGAKQAYLIARGYDYQAIKKTGIVVPSKIEIFKADVSAMPQNRIIELDFYTLQSVGF
jgi:hypothetical protein